MARGASSEGRTNGTRKNDPGRIMIFYIRRLGGLVEKILCDLEELSKWYVGTIRGQHQLPFIHLSAADFCRKNIFWTRFLGMFKFTPRN